MEEDFPAVSQLKNCPNINAGTTEERPYQAVGRRQKADFQIGQFSLALSETTNNLVNDEPNSILTKCRQPAYTCHGSVPVSPWMFARLCWAHAFMVDVLIFLWKPELVDVMGFRARLFGCSCFCLGGHGRATTRLVLRGGAGTLFCGHCDQNHHQSNLCISSALHTLSARPTKLREKKTGAMLRVMDACRQQLLAPPNLG